MALPDDRLARHTRLSFVAGFTNGEKRRKPASRSILTTGVPFAFSFVAGLPRSQNNQRWATRRDGLRLHRARSGSQNKRIPELKRSRSHAVPLRLRGSGSTQVIKTQQS